MNVPILPERLHSASPEDFLVADAIIDGDHPEVVALGRDLRRRHATDAEFARAVFEWVRDKISHSYDAQDSRVTLAASEVLSSGVGLCYAKSNLLAALLRGQGIPAGLCYQLLESQDGSHVLHGLAAIYIEGAWHRQDPRGNKPGIDAQFSVEGEILAYVIDESRGERDYPYIFQAPVAEVVDALRAADDVLTCQLPSRIDRTAVPFVGRQVF